MNVPSAIFNTLSQAETLNNGIQIELQSPHFAPQMHRHIKHPASREFSLARSLSHTPCCFMPLVAKLETECVIMLIYYTFYKRRRSGRRAFSSSWPRELLSPLKHKCTLSPTETAIHRLIYLSERALDSSLAFCLTLAISRLFLSL